MKKSQIEVIGLVVALVALVVIAAFILKPAKPVKKATTPDAKTTKVAKAGAPADTSVRWVLPDQVASAIPNVDGGRDPFKDLSLPVGNIDKPAVGPKPGIMPGQQPGPIIPSTVDQALPGPGDVKPALPEPPAIVVKGIVFSGDKRFVALLADDKPYTLYRGEQIPGTDWSVAEIAPSEITLKNGNQTARFRLSGGS